MTDGAPIKRGDQQGHHYALCYGLKCPCWQEGVKDTTKLYRLMGRCEVGRNSFGPMWNTRKLVRVLHAFTRDNERADGTRGDRDA